MKLKPAYVLLIVILINACLYLYVVSPLIQRSADTKNQIAAINTEIQQSQQMIDSIPEYKRIIVEKKINDTTKYATVYTKLEKDLITSLVDEMIVASGMAGTEYSLPEVTEPGVQPLTLTFNETSYQAVVDFMSRVESLNKTVIVKNVQLQGDDIVGGSIYLEFYYSI